MARKKMFKGPQDRPAGLPSGSGLLWGRGWFQALWRAGFIWSAGTPVPPAWSRWVSEFRQQRSDESEIQDLLLERGSQGPEVSSATP